MTLFLPEGKRLHTPENRAAVESERGLRAAMERGEILEARAVLCDREHNLIVDLPAMRGVIPRQEGALGLCEGTVRDIAVISRVGRPVCFTVRELLTDADGLPYAVLSRAQAQRMCAQRYVTGLVPGDIIPARVTRTEPFGAFCDIGCGLAALMPVDTISVSRIRHPRERFEAGMDIFAVVKARVDTRVTLSHKELLGTWEENVSCFSAGDTVTGVIRSVENYGAFVELAPNLTGLAELKDGLRVGDRACVYIKSINPQRMKLKLAVIDSFPDDSPILPPEYFLTHGHIDRFVYSPPECDKMICTEFI